MTTRPQALASSQYGASLIEVLVSLLILAFGLLSLGGMIGYSVQAPKLAVNRAVATNVASDYIDRIRANPTAVSRYGQAASSYDGTTADIALNDCKYPTCNATKLADMDIAAIRRAARLDLPAGGVLVQCEGACDDVNPQANTLNLWVIWQEAETLAALDAAKTDNCPANLPASGTKMAPRCLYVRFKL